MKNKILRLMMLCMLFGATSITSAFAQNQDGEYKEALKKMLKLSGANSSSDAILEQMKPLFQKIGSQNGDSLYNDLMVKWKNTMEEKLIDIYAPIYQRHLALKDLKEVIAFYESPVGKRLGGAAPQIIKDAFPSIQKACMDMVSTVMFKVSSPKMTETCVPVKEPGNNDRELFAEGYVLPKDSVEVSPIPYDRAKGNQPVLYSIEKRKNDTKVTFSNPIYFDSQWVTYGSGFKIIDKDTGDEYSVRGYDGGGASFDRLLIVRGFNRKNICVSLLFPKLKKGFKNIDIIEVPNERDLVPSNCDGKSTAIYNVKVADYVKGTKEKKKVCY